MNPFPYIDDDIMHILILVFSAALLLISANAYRKRPSSRYRLLMLAFGFLLLSQTVESLQSIFLFDSLITIPIVGLHLSHFLILMMLLSFAVALTRGTKSETNP